MASSNLASEGRKGGPVLDARIKNHRLWHLGSPFQWAAWDAIAAAGCSLVAFRLTPAHQAIASVDTHVKTIPAAVIFAIAAFISSYVIGFRRQNDFRSRFRGLLLVLTLVLACWGIASIGISFLIYKQIGRHIIAIWMALFFALEVCAHLIWRTKMITAVHQVAVCGDEAFCRRMAALLKQAPFPVNIAYAVQPAFSPGSAFEAMLADPRLHEVVVHDVPSVFNESLLSLLDRGVAVSSTDAFAERHFLKIPCVFIGPEWFFKIDLRQHHPFYYGTKRLLDILLSFLGGLLTAPLLALAVVAITLEDRGAVFYSQTRVGLLQKPFTIWKLRTMRRDSEKTGPRWAATNDPRVTRVGRVLRILRIDEVPQFWNVFRGEMALVGPRPERPEFVVDLAKSIPFYRQRHLLKPGLTGWAQISYRYGASEDDAREKLAYDFYYLKNASLLLDLQILLQTLGVITRGSR